VTALRFRSRHVHRTIYQYVVSSLATLGWPDVAAAEAGTVVNFGSSANQGIATSIASDVKTLFEDRYMQVKDFTADPPTDSQEYLEFDKDDVSITRPPGTGATDFRRYWRVVNTTARIYYVPD
jgi:hypothetical protein